MMLFDVHDPHVFVESLVVEYFTISNFENAREVEFSQSFK